MQGYASSIFLCHYQPCLTVDRVLQGDTVTKGLKKVTDDMKSKNRADRTGVVSTSAGLASIWLLTLPQQGTCILSNC